MITIFGSLMVGLVTMSGLILKNDPTGRMIIGSVWIVLTVIWLVLYINKKTRKG